ncbi:MBL fold metallo-hydrolase [Bacteroidota bacterium]
MAISVSPVSLINKHSGKTTDKLLQELMSVSEGMGICWLGNIGWLLYAENKLIAFDLDLLDDLRINPSPISLKAIASRLDVHFVTHEHDDHFNQATSEVLAQHSDCLFVIPEFCRPKAERIRIPDERIVIATPNEPFEIKGIDVHPIPAMHGHKKFTIVFRSPHTYKGCGYKIRLAGKVIMQPGDSVLLLEHLEQTDVNVLFVSPTVHNMYIDRSSVLIQEIKPDYTFPQHFGTYKQNEKNEYWTKGYPDELYNVLPEEFKRRYHKLEQGQIFLIR